MGRGAGIRMAGAGLPGPHAGRRTGGYRRKRPARTGRAVSRVGRTSQMKKPPAGGLRAAWWVRALHRERRTAAAGGAGVRVADDELGAFEVFFVVDFGAD